MDSSNPTLSTLNIILDQILDYLTKHPDTLDIPGIFREMGSPLAIAKGLMHIAEDPINNTIETFEKEFFDNKHNLSGLYKYALKTVKDPFSKKDNVKAVINEVSRKLNENVNVDFNDVITSLIDQQNHEEAKYLYQHSHLCWLIAQHEAKNHINLSNAVLIMCGMEFQDYLFGQLPLEHQLIFNMKLQKTIVSALSDAQKIDFSQHFSEAFPQAASQAQVVGIPQDQSEKAPQETVEEAPVEDTKEDQPAEEESKGAEKVQPFAAHQEKLKGLFKNVKGMAEKTITDFTKGKPAPAKEEQAENAQDASAKPQEAQTTQTEDTQTAQKPQMFAEQQEMVKGLFKDIKGMAEKTISDFTKKPSGKPAAPVQPAVQKEPVDYKKEALKTFKKSKRIFKEMVALTLDKDLPIDSEEDEKESLELLTLDEFIEKTNEIEAHLKNYYQAVADENKEEMGKTRQVCRSDQAVVNILIADVEKELQTIYMGFQEGADVEALANHLESIKKSKWRRIAKIKEMDESEVICQGDDFDNKFETIVTLNVGITQAIQSMLYSGDKEDDDTTDNNATDDSIDDNKDA